MIHQRLALLATIILLTTHARAQNIDSAIQTISPKYLDKVALTSSRVERKLEKKSEKTLEQWQKQEAKLQRKLARFDSLKAKSFFGDAEQQYQRLGQRLESVSSKQYMPALDTLVTSIKFLQQSPRFLGTTKGTAQKLTDVSAKLKSLEGRFQKAEEIKKFLKERNQYLKERLKQLGTGTHRYTKQIRQLNKQFYYYSQQVNEFRELVKDHNKAVRKALELLGKTRLFKDFMRNNSQLAALFRLPGDPNDPVAQSNLAGLQTRAQVSGLIQQQLSSSGPDAQAQFRQNLQNAQTQLSQLKNRLNKPGGSSGDILPEGFKPNNEKTKSFLQRLEYGTNFQSQKPNGYFPVTTDIGLSLGYKLNEKSLLGIGASYKIGWGQNIRNITVTHQGVGLRSFIDWKIKGSFWVSGGYEMNYRNQFNRMDVLKDLNAWQQSGLLGMSKVVSLKTKFFKKTKVQLLWDFLSYEQVPRTQPLVLRIGYSLK